MNLPLKWKITLGITLTSIISVLIAVLTIVAIEQNRIENKLITNALTLSKIIGSNSTGALDFADIDSAHEVLLTLKANKHIHKVAIFDSDNKPFAWYQWTGKEADSPLLGDSENFPATIPPPQQPEISTSDTQLEIFEPIKSEGGQVGMIYMSLDLDEISEATAHFYRISAMLCGVVTVFSLLLAWVIQKAITRPINQVVLALKDIAQGEGDLTQRLTTSSSDELGELAKWFNVFVDKIQNVVIRFRDNSHNLTQAASELKALSANTNQAILRQESELEQVATAINQMSSTVQEVERNITTSATDTEEADNQANIGNQVVVETMDAISILANDIESASDVIANLQKDSESIGAVLDVIRGIAEQTNLLALNAAIEAARAGEQGRGFAVVADEVRTLASRTQESTEEIHDMIEKLQLGARDAVQVMDKGRNQAHDSVEKAQLANESLAAITQAVAIIKDMSQQIASASAEQTHVTEEISRNIVNISQVAMETSGESKEMTDKSHQLDQLSSDMLQLVNQFKV